MRGVPEGMLTTEGDPMADLSIKELDQVLQGWRGRTIRVEKEEQGPGPE